MKFFKKKPVAPEDNTPNKYTVSYLLKMFPVAVLLCSFLMVLDRGNTESFLNEWLDPSQLLAYAFINIFLPFLYLMPTLLFKSRRNWASVVGIYGKWSRFIVMLMSIVIVANLLNNLIKMFSAIQ